MFKKFSPKEDVASNTILKSSAQRSVRAKLLQQMPYLSTPVPNDDPPTSQTVTSNVKAVVAGNETSEEDVVVVVTVLDAIWPKKENLHLVKCRDHVTILVLQGEPLFFQHFEGLYFPTLKLSHCYPDLIPSVRVDRGAIKFVLSGANIMCPGLTSTGALQPEPTPFVEKSSVVKILAQGKQNACAIGLTNMSSDEMKTINKGIGVENVHWLGDDLWSLDKL